MTPWSTEAGNERIRDVELKKDGLETTDLKDIEKKGDDCPDYEPNVVHARDVAQGEHTVKRKLKARHL